MNKKNSAESASSGSAWSNWNSRLNVFEEWRKQKHSPIVRSWWSYLARLVQRELTSLNIEPGVCLDVGCGTGNYLSRTVSGHEFGVGIDPLRSSLSSSKKTLKRNGLNAKVDVILAVGEYLPLKDNCLQLSIMTGSLDHVNDPNLVADEFQRVLNRGGYLMVLETALITRESGFYDETHVNQFSKTYLKRLLRKFQILKVSTKVPIFSQIHISDGLLGYNPLHKILTRIPGVIGNFFNYSEVLLECKKS